MSDDDDRALVTAVIVAVCVAVMIGGAMWLR